MTTSSTDATPGPRNEIDLCGRLVHDPTARELPSGDPLVTLRVSVPRAPAGRRPGVDWVDCVLWTARLRRAASRWRAGDWVEVSGTLRRRYVRGAGAPGTLVEVEAHTARRVHRADRSQSVGAALD